MLARLRIYLSEMFPLWEFLPYALVSFGGLYLVVQALQGAATLVLGPVALVGFASYFALSLLMRIFDEFKDLEVDRQLFPHRPLPRGAVRPGDLRALGLFLVITAILLNLACGWLVWPFLAALGFGWLSFKWFFCERAMRNNLLLALVTHQPMVLFVNAYIAATALYALSPTPPSAVDGRLLLALFGFFFPVTAWETSRKIRAPSQETEYVTYSSLLGPRRATLLPMVFLGLTATLLVLLLQYLAAPLWVGGLIGLVAAGHLLIGLRFILTPSAAHNVVKPATEVAASLMFAVFLIYLLATRPISLVTL